MRPGRLASLSALLLLAASTTGRAGLIVTLGPAGGITVPQGGSAIFDILVHSDSGPLNVGSFALTLNLTSAPGDRGRLEFATTQGGDPNSSVGQPTNFNETAAHIPYIFRGNSDAASHPADFAHVGRNLVPNDQYSSIDNTINFATDVSVGSSNFLLAQVIVTSSRSAPIQPGDRFTISLDPGFGNTYFTTADGSVDVPYNVGAFTTATVGLAAVPEPSTVVLLGIGLAGLLARHRVRRVFPAGGQTD